MGAQKATGATSCLKRFPMRSTYNLTLMYWTTLCRLVSSDSINSGYCTTSSTRAHFTERKKNVWPLSGPRIFRGLRVTNHRSWYTYRHRIRHISVVLSVDPLQSAVFRSFQQALKRPAYKSLAFLLWPEWAYFFVFQEGPSAYAHHNTLACHVSSSLDRVKQRAHTRSVEDNWVSLKQELHGLETNSVQIR
jgi:hypothetical protein